MLTEWTWESVRPILSAAWVRRCLPKSQQPAHCGSGAVSGWTPGYDGSLTLPPGGGNARAHLLIVSCGRAGTI